MKKILIRLLAAIGLVPARTYAALKLRLDESNRASRVWKKRADKMGVRVKDLEDKLQAQIHRLKDDARGAAERESRRQNSDLTTIQTQLTETERALGLAREQLTAIEVKLDILEGAANVLDARTRTATQ